MRLVVEHSLFNIHNRFFFEGPAYLRSSTTMHDRLVHVTASNNHRPIIKQACLIRVNRNLLVTFLLYAEGGNLMIINLACVVRTDQHSLIHECLVHASIKE